MTVLKFIRSSHTCKKVGQLHGCVSQQSNFAEELGNTHVVNVVLPLAKLLTRDQFSEIQEMDMDTPL
jgi:hypothetical protein